MSNRILVVLGVLAGCGAEPLGMSSEALSTGADDQGTALSATISPDTACTGPASARLTVTGSFLSSASASPVTVALYVDGALAISGLERPDWERDTRFKRAAYTRTTTVSNGSHVVEVCLYQPGAIGRLPKGFCTQPIEIDVMCSSLCSQPGLSSLTDNRWFQLCR